VVATGVFTEACRFSTRPRFFFTIRSGCPSTTGAFTLESPERPPYNEEVRNPNPEGTMTDSFTKEPIRVIREEEDAWPYIYVRLDQLDMVKKILDNAGYRYAVNEEAFSFNDEPYTTVVHLDFRLDAAAVQKLLDDHEDPKLTRQRRSRSGHRG
jgi:hypothetical protein